ncbi:MAG: DnaJ family molecular chaperone [Hyphomicrobiaceae bacterium]
MFERNRVEAIEHSGVAVEITTDAGETISGQMVVGAGRNLSQVLNGDGGFIEFEPWGGDRMYVSKSSLRAIKPAQAPRPESLKGRINAMDGFDPYMILGVRKGADLDEAKNAWRRLSMAYHPDRYAMAELPDEVTTYLAGMARRVNAAYAALETALANRKTVPLRQTPVHAPPRG